MTEGIFEVAEAAEGGFDARALGHSIFTQGEDWDDQRRPNYQRNRTRSR